VRNINDRFTATMTNRVRWRDAEEPASGPRDSTAAGSGGSVTAEQAGGSGSSASPQAANPDSGRQRQITSDTDIKVRVCTLTLHFQHHQLDETAQ